MDLDYFFSAGVFVQLALLSYVLGLLARKELVLRGLILAGTTFYIIYYYYIGDQPLWDAIWASSVIGMTNLIMILVILRERSTIGMGPEMVALYGAFPTLNPGQFRQIMKHAHWVEAEEETQICAQGVRPDHLVLISRGAMYIQRGGKQVRIDEGNFIGEISFLTNGAASADVVAPTGTQYVMWERVRLEALMEKSPRLSNAIGALLNKDIARKLGKSWPEALGG